MHILIKAQQQQPPYIAVSPALPGSLVVALSCFDPDKKHVQII